MSMWHRPKMLAFNRKNHNVSSVKDTYTFGCHQKPTIRSEIVFTRMVCTVYYYYSDFYAAL